MIWRGSLHRLGYPVYGKHRRTLRKVVYALMGKKLMGKNKLAPSCGNKRCLSDKCIRQDSVSAMTKLAYKTTVNRATHRANCIKTARRRWAKLDMEKAAEIRASGERTAVLAERYGVSAQTIRDTRNGDRWRDYSSPWAGLVA